jgi:hypothetical protein
LRGVTSGNGFLRALGTGSAGDGGFGVPVAARFDLDGDGNVDFAKANMLDSPLGRTRAGGVQLIFGDGQIAADVDLGVANTRVLPIFGDGNQEATGGEIWMADLTGDGLGELMIARPNFRASNPDRIGAVHSVGRQRPARLAVARRPDSYDGRVTNEHDANRWRLGRRAIHQPAPR